MGMNELMNQQMIHERPTSLKLLPRNSSLPFTPQLRGPEDCPSGMPHAQEVFSQDRVSQQLCTILFSSYFGSPKTITLKFPGSMFF